MTFAKQLAQFVVFSVGMAATVGLSLWVLLGPLHLASWLASQGPRPPAITSEPVSAPATTPEPITAGTPESALAHERKPIDPGRSGVPGDSGPFVTQMQGALLNKGYSVGPAGADSNFNDDTLTALEAFQDNKAFSVRPTCDRQCWTALGLPDSK